MWVCERVEGVSRAEQEAAQQVGPHSISLPLLLSPSPADKGFPPLYRNVHTHQRSIIHRKQHPKAHPPCTKQPTRQSAGVLENRTPKKRLFKFLLRAHALRATMNGAVLDNEGVVDGASRMSGSLGLSPTRC